MIALLSIFATAQAADVVFNVVVPQDPTKPNTHVTNQVWIVGSFNDWNNNQKQLTKVDATHYTITMDDATFKAGVTPANMRYKYLSGGGDWAYVEKRDSAGIEKELTDRWYTAGKNDTVARWALTWKDIAPLPKTVTISALVPVEVVQLYIVGTFNGWTLPTDSTKMTLAETTVDGKIFTVTFKSSDVNKLKYKFCAGPAWDYEQTVGDIVYPDVNQSTAQHVITAFKKIFDPTKVGNVNITATVPVGTQRAWIMGSHLGWNWANLQEGTKNIDGTFSFVATNVMSIEYRLYNWNTAWSHPEAKDGEPTVERPNRIANFPADANIAITVSAWRNEAPNALPGLNADKYKVYSSNKSIVVEGVTSKAELFDISGRSIESKVMSGTFRSAMLNAGLYIVKIDGQTQKVSVK